MISSRRERARDWAGALSYIQSPFSDRLGHGGIGRIDRLDQPERQGCAA